MAMDEVIQWTDKYGSMIVILYSLRGQFWPIPILKSGHRTWDSWICHCFTIHGGLKT